ncbi:hypothetical protein SCUCBS95973_008468 [Sporothrix curviconia]|uniref:RNA-dependent RNA polymerase n=1 Tax=Sporothrix curviconia TaxID=1260050 RepID=A0ABP0CLU3_9PEZI
MGPKVRPQPQPPAPPVTPVKARRLDNDPGRQRVEMLNQIYNLGVPVAEGPQSPADKERMARVDVHFRRYNSITNLLRIHHYKEPHRLQAVLDDFDAQARERSSNWVPKPCAARGVIPSPRAGSPPKAQRMEDQVAMQELLLFLLETSRTAMVQVQPAAAAAASNDDNNNAQRWSPAPAGPTMVAVNVNIYTPSPVHDATLAADIDRVPVIMRIGQPAVRERPQARFSMDENQDLRGLVPENGRPRSPGGSSTSSAMYSALDSFEEPPFPSQTTVDAGNTDVGNETEEFPDEEWYRSMPLRRPASQESFAASDGLLEAMEESFGLFANVASPAPAERPDSRDSTSTTYSSIPDMENLQITDVGDAPDKPESGPWNPVPGLWDPPTPTWLKQAPFPIIWETTRIASRCGVKLQDVEMTYSPTWEDQGVFLTALQSHPKLQGKRFPEPSTQVAWDSALNRHASRGAGAKRVAVYSILMGFNKSTSGPLYTIHLQPISIDLPHRLSRHFGSDRFLEILFPSHHSSITAVPHILRNHEAAVREVNHWMTREHHEFAGRSWSAFYTKADGFRKPTSNSRAGLGETDESILLNRVFFFAEDGAGICLDDADTNPGSPRQTGPLRVHEMLDWLLQFNKFPENRKQPYLKLFSRIALGLSRTKETVVFEPSQIRHHKSDLLSPTSKVMNDGVARMSLSVARKLRSALELSDLPVAVQGRIGSAKGMWVLDTEDTGREDWIETYPSQRKWECDGLDADHRTLEVRNYASEARSASLNLQFIPVLEDRAIDKTRMRCVLGSILEGSLTRDLAEQRAALENPLLFSMWAHENSRYRNDHVIHCQVPFLGGLPDRDEDAIQFLLAGGFDPMSQRFLWEKAYNMQKQRCEKLNEKLSIRVGRTAYLLMVVDFLGVLKEGEVQVCFSSKFQVEPDGEPDEHGDDGSFSDTLLVGTDVLVARSPAHFTSDMQKVRCVFRQELCALKDVIVFSSKGNSPLAEMLSGGDYDGDIAWVCWDPRIVDNFANAGPPPEYKLLEMGYMRKIRTTVDQLAAAAAATSPSSSPPGRNSAGLSPHVLADMVERSFAFNTKENLLGKLTVYKEDLCYMRRSIGDKTANVLSTLLSDLVDQAKQGNDFTKQDFERLRVDLLEGFRTGTPAPQRLEKPAYKRSSRSPRAKKAGHIVDYLKFDVAKPVIRRELRALSDLRDAMSSRDSDRGGRRESGSGGRAGGDNSFWDADLAAPAKDFEALALKSEVCYAIFEALKSDIREVCLSWEKEIRQWSSGKPSSGGSGSGDTFDDPGFRQRFLQLYKQWCDIFVRLPEMKALPTMPTATPAAATGSPAAAKLKKKGLPIADLDVDAETIPWLLQQGYLADREYSLWALIRASQAFRMLYRRGIVWRLAGRQLQMIKAMMTGHGHNGLGGAKVLMTPLTFAAMRPDRKIIKRMTARMQGAEVAGIDYADDDNLFADDDT